VIGIPKADCTVDVVSYGSSTLRQLLRCYRELLVTDLIKNILDLDSLWFSWFVTDVSGQHIREKFVGQAVEEGFFLNYLTRCTLSKIPEVRSPHFYRGRILRCIKLSSDRHSVINLIYMCLNRMYRLMVTAAVQNVERRKITGMKIR